MSSTQHSPGHVCCLPERPSVHPSARPPAPQHCVACHCYALATRNPDKNRKTCGTPRTHGVCVCVWHIPIYIWYGNLGYTDDDWSIHWSIGSERCDINTFRRQWATPVSEKVHFSESILNFWFGKYGVHNLFCVMSEKLWSTKFCLKDNRSTYYTLPRKCILSVRQNSFVYAKHYVY